MEIAAYFLMEPPTQKPTDNPDHAVFFMFAETLLHQTDETAC